MPASKGNGRKKNRRHRDNRNWIQNDITVDDFANNVKIFKSIPKKKAVSSLVDRFDTLNMDDDDDDRAWDEKSDDEYEQKLTKSTKKYRRKNHDADVEFGVNYPLDIWFLISDYIRPEDVGIFAAICHSTDFVITTAKFWFSLYKRYHNWNPVMPEELNRWNMDRVRGLRASVIRSLFYMYQPFMSRVRPPAPLTVDPSVILRYQCILQWHVKHTQFYTYYFKFSNYTEKRKGIGSFASNMPDLISHDSLVYFNPEEDCTILEITTPGFCKAEMVVGQYLSIALLGLTTNLCNHRLKLEFAPAHLLTSNFSSTKFKGKRQLVPTTQIIIEPVREMNIYPWWHPKYFQCRYIEDEPSKENDVI